MPTPTETHQRFVAAGKWCTRFAVPFAKLDLPDTLDLHEDRPMLFAGNHRSFFDVVATLAIFAKFDISSRILIRADMVDSGFPGVLLRNVGSIAASRETREQAEADAVSALSRGETVSMMPEGRLVPPADRAETGVGPARPGLSRIARRAGAVVIPVAFIDTDRVWPRGGLPRPRVRRPVARIRVGDPVEMIGDDDQANVDHFMGELAALIRNNALPAS